MWRNEKVAVGIASLYLLIYLILLHVDGTRDIAMLLFFVSPFLLVWMVVTILKNGHFDGRELQDNEEYGYSDRPKK